MRELELLTKLCCFGAHDYKTLQTICCHNVTMLFYESVLNTVKLEMFRRLHRNVLWCYLCYFPMKGKAVQLVLLETDFYYYYCYCQEVTFSVWFVCVTAGLHKTTDFPGGGKNPLTYEVDPEISRSFGLQDS